MSDQDNLPDGEVGQHAAFLLWQRDMQKQLAENMESEHSAFLSEFTQFLSELTHDQTRMVREVLEKAGDPHVRIELAGITIGSQVFMQGLTVEGKDANEEWAKLTTGLEPEPDQEIGHMPVNDGELILGSEMDEIGRSSNTIAASYGLEEEFTPGGKSKGFKCKACGKNYGTVADRVETEERFGGCLGCHHKQKWG